MSDAHRPAPAPGPDAQAPTDTPQQRQPSAGIGSTSVLYGGQAVIEGVMMRGRDAWAVAVRRPDHGIYVEQHPLRPLAVRQPLFRLPLLRGIGVLADSLVLGVRALSIAGNQSVAEEERLTERQMGWTLATGAIFFSALFIALPAFGTGWLSNLVPNELLFNLINGLVRIAMFLGYIALISRLPEIRRTFEYHGAEHMSIHCHEAGRPLTQKNVGEYPTEHVRCGTNFLLLLFILMLVLFTAGYGIFGRPPLLARILIDVAAVPLIAGISYEFLRLGAGREHSRWVRPIMLPGLWLQKLTTKQPDEDQIEVAIRALQHVLPADERARVPDLPAPLEVVDQHPAPDAAGADAAAESGAVDPGRSSGGT